MLSPNLEGLFVTNIPFFSNVSILDFASPFPPAIIAPACPILLPGGAVWPAIKDTIGNPLGLFLDIHSAASSSAYPPISPIIIIPLVSGSFINLSKQSIKLVPLKGSPPIPTQVD